MVRQGLNVIRNLSHLSSEFLHAGLDFRRILLQLFEFERQHCEPLVDVVMKLSSNASAFLRSRASSTVFLSVMSSTIAITSGDGRWFNNDRLKHPRPTNRLAENSVFPVGSRLSNPPAIFKKRASPSL